MELVRGENLIFTFPVVDVNGDPLAISALSGLKVEVVQYDRIKAIYNFKPGTADEEIRINPDVNTSFDFELTKDLSGMLKKGQVELKIFMSKTDSDFVVDPDWTDIDIVELCTMV